MLWVILGLILCAVGILWGFAQLAGILIGTVLGVSSAVGGYKNFKESK